MGQADQRFIVGQLVFHQRYHYRGVIVAFDLSCQAEESWYLKNQTQPARQQPWYHVLVDQAQHHTYVAQSNLVEDSLGAEIINPYVPMFFDGFEDGHYQRNNLEFG